jgi:hypothetical protein
MSEKDIRRYTLEEIRAMKGRTDWDKLRDRGDFDGPDEDDFEVDWSNAVLAEGFLKKPVSIRLDSDVLEFFKAQGPGYQTRMNAVLRAYMKAVIKRA